MASGRGVLEPLRLPAELPDEPHRVRVLLPLQVDGGLLQDPDRPGEVPAPHLHVEEPVPGPLHFVVQERRGGPHPPPPPAGRGAGRGGRPPPPPRPPRPRRLAGGARRRGGPLRGGRGGRGRVHPPPSSPPRSGG